MVDCKGPCHSLDRDLNFLCRERPPGATNMTPCLYDLDLFTCEDGYRWVKFTCREHGSSWRLYAGGITKLPCIALESVLSPEGRSAVEGMLDENVDYEELEGAF